MRPRFTGLLLASGLLSAQTPRVEVDFLKDVQPVLTAKCMACHSGEGAQAGLRAHTRDDLVKGGKSGPSIIPGKGADSLLVARMEGRKGVRMPPTGPPVSAEAIERIRLWIDRGAPFDAAKGLADRTPDRIAPLAPRTPAIPPGDAPNPVDRFVDAYFKRKGVAWPQPAPDGIFARRAWLDITGLPPAPEELEGKNKEQNIDRLLAKRRAYAEHWISFWNDLLRNDEGVIYHGERKSITAWLLAALEKNMPYDEMVRSLLNPAPSTGPEGFLIGVTWRGVVSASQVAPMQAAQNAAQIFLGINLKCAACHDSFINRWQLRDTYGLASMFSPSALELVRCDVPLGATAEAKFPFPELKVRFDDTLPTRQEAAAEWFTHPENGRFARTIVNRYWKQLLGRGIVEPADDMDAEAWDQDLLDWLASDFAAHKYDLQHLLRCIITSRTYQLAAAEEKQNTNQYVFRGPRLRRLTAEQFQDAISAVTGDWRVHSPRTDIYSTYTREWRLKSDPLSRVLGRPIRDQVYTERSSDATTLQALELTNGPLLSKRLERGAKALLGELPPAPTNIFDSKVVRGGVVPVDVDITGASELWLLIEDVDSYDPSRVVAGWVDGEFAGPTGAVKVEIPSGGGIPSTRSLKIPGKIPGNINGGQFTRFRAKAVIDESSRKSDIGPAVRFFVFTEKPNPDQLIRVQGNPPYLPPGRKWQAGELADRLYAHLLVRKPSPAERKTAEEVMGGARLSSSGVEDLLWALLMSPEFQYIH